MRSIGIAATVLLAMFAGCSALREPSPNSSPERPAPQLAEAAHVIALGGDEFSDLAFLRPLLEGKRIVQLGENAHGIREYNLAKARLVQFLHEEMGFDVLAFESALYQCYDADLRADTASAAATLTNCAFGVWHTEEVLPLFEYLRTSRATDRPLRLAGIDVQPIGRNKAGRPHFLSSVVAPIDHDFAAAVRELDSTFLHIYAQGGRERRAYFRSDAGRRMIGAYDSLASYIAANETAILAARGASTRDAAIVARQTARSMATYIRQQAAPTTREYVEHRDRGMAENLTFLLDELYPDRKIIVWGHNFHIRHDNLAIPPDSTMFPDVPARTMGSWIYERYGDQVYTVGLYAGSGRAADNSGTVYEIAPPDPVSLESLLEQLGPGAHFLDLAEAAARTDAARHVDRPITARYNGTTPLPMILRDQYDAILFISKVTPRKMLY